MDWVWNASLHAQNLNIFPETGGDVLWGSKTIKEQGLTGGPGLLTRGRFLKFIAILSMFLV